MIWSVYASSSVVRVSTYITGGELPSAKLALMQFRNIAQTTSREFRGITLPETIQLDSLLKEKKEQRLNRIIKTVTCF